MAMIRRLCFVIWALIKWPFRRDRPIRCPRCGKILRAIDDDHDQYCPVKRMSEPPKDSAYDA
jgi:hypothetical protein